jgi:hypothetical protein
MHGRDLPVAHVHDFFRIAFGVRGAIGRTVAQGEKGEPLGVKIITAESGDIPTQL